MPAAYLSKVIETERTIIEPPDRLSFNFYELWKYRELFYFFAWRDIKVKYKQTYLGILWAILQPLALMLLFSFVFKNIHPHTTRMHYEIFVLAGIIVWNFFNSAISNASDSIITHSNIIKKIYFPRLIIPASSLLTAFFDFLIALFLFMLFCGIFNEMPDFTVFLYWPLAIFQLLMSAFGIGVFLSALTLKYRDFRYVIPFALQLLFFGSQIIYSLTTVAKGNWKYLLAINPMNGIIEMFRTPFLKSMNLHIVLIGMLSTLTFTFVGLYYFRKTEAHFADIA
jgi:lipopolysaccharide transport system permease protein